jgi:hypothetical protein
VSTIARPRHVLDVTGTDRVDAFGENDRHSAARSLQRRHGPADTGEDGVRAERYQFRRISEQARDIPLLPRWRFDRFLRNRMCAGGGPPKWLAACLGDH